MDLSLSIQPNLFWAKDVFGSNKYFDINKFSKTHHYIFFFSFFFILIFSQKNIFDIENSKKITFFLKVLITIITINIYITVDSDKNTVNNGNFIIDDRLYIFFSLHDVVGVVLTF